MAEQPPLSRIHVIGYSANDRDFPLLAQVLDPRVAGYQVPKDLSACPDKRYPNHVFTGAQPIAGDQRVRHVWEILPSPWVPFTRYDDDLGPVQGRRRSVKNEGQVASLTADKRTTYEAREGSAIVYTELEETWSIKTDEDGNSLFPIRDRDFYDPSRGPVQERRQLFVPTGEEEGSLENVNGVITQTSYEPYNEFLSVKIVQTYKVDGPQLIGKATDNEGQLVTITTQRKAADGYVPPNPSATRTVEASREDAESLVERIVDTPQVFGAEVFRKTREDITPQKFKAAQEDTTSEQNIEGTASPTITLATGEFAKSEQQINKFVKRVSTTSRAISEAVTLVEKVLTNEGQVGTRTLNLQAGDQSFTPSATLVDASVEALGDGRTVKSETVVPNVFAGKSVVKTKVDLTPEKFRAAQQDTTTEESVEGTVNPNVSLGTGEFRKSEQQVTEFVKRVSTTNRDISASTDLTETLITPQGQVATRTLRLSSETQSIQPDALLVDGSIEALGDGRTIKTEVKVGQVFDAKTLSASKPDVIPEQFRASAPAETIQETVAQESVTIPSLGANELEKSEQRVTEFTVRKTTTSRDNGSLPTLRGQDYEPNINVVIPFEQRVESSGAALGNAATFVDPLSSEFDLVREVDLQGVEQELSSVILSFPTRTSLALPKILKGVTVVWDAQQSDGDFASDWDGDYVGEGWNLSGAESCSAEAYAAVSPSFKIDIEEVYASNIPTTSYFFLLKYPITVADILNKLGQIIGSNVLSWPVFKTQSHVLSASGGSSRGDARATASQSASGTETDGKETSSFSRTVGEGKSRAFTIETTTVTLPPTIHGNITIRSETAIGVQIPNNGPASAAEAANATIDWPQRKNFQKVNFFVTASASITGRMPANLFATGTQTDIPRSGLYLIDSKVEIYQYGFARVYAEVLDASIFA